MKKFLCLLLTAVMLLTMTACSLLPSDWPQGSNADDTDNSDTPVSTPGMTLPDNPTINVPDNIEDSFDAVLLDAYEKDGMWYVVYCEPVMVSFAEKDVKALAVGGTLNTAYGNVSITELEDYGTGLAVNGEYYFTPADDGTYTMTVGVMPYFTKGEEQHEVPVAANVTIWDEGFDCDCSDLETMFKTHYKKTAYELSDEFFVGMTIVNGEVTSIMRMDF